MATELDTFLASLRGATADITGIADRIKAQNQEAALKQAYGQVPGMLRGGQNLEAGAMLAQAGDPFLLRETLKRSMEPKSAPINPELLQSLSGGADSKLFEGLTPEQQLSMADKLGGRKLQQKNLALQERSENRLTRVEAGKSQDWFKEIKKIQKEFADQDKLFRNVNAALEMGTQPADAVVFNFIARNIAGEKGPLAEGDIARLKGAYGEETYNKVVQYITSEGKSTLTPVQRKAYMDLVKTAANNYQSFKDEVVGNQLADAARFEGSLFNPETGKLDRRAQKYFKDFGFELEKDPEGFFVAVKKSQKREAINANQSAVPGSIRQQGSQETEVTSLVQQIKDPTVKAQAEAAIRAYAGREVPQALIQRIKQAAGGQ